MKASKFSDARKAFILKQGDHGVSVAENYRLKKIVADLTLDREMLQDVIRRKL